jgi:hypothetical protein
MNDKINTPEQGAHQPPGASDSALEARARRAAQKVGLRAIKSRWRRDSVDNYGGFQIVDPYFNRVEAGVRFDMSAAEVIEFCRE